jgi:hypothetical protein
LVEKPVPGSLLFHIFNFIGIFSIG